MAVYQNPLETRYASRDMLEIFSEETKFLTWRDCWIALAEAERELGLPITDEQIEDLKKNRENLNLERAREIEKEIHHDVMSHIRAYGEVAPKAAGIIHLGATSCFVTDNTDVILYRRALTLVRKRLVSVIRTLRARAWEYRNLPVLGYTHLQPAQPTTLGKRISLWLYDFLLDLEELEYRMERLMLRGAKGTTGTQASFMELFEGDREKVRKLDRLVAQKLGFDRVVPVSGQTLTRKLDVHILQLLSNIATTAHRACNDVRLMQHSWQVEEPFDKKQVGSSAMPYKRNPILAERITALARYVMNDVQNASYTYANQFLERTLDDSANRRISMAEGFLAVDAILILCQRLFSGMQVYPEVIHKIMMQNLPFYATENILMEAVKRGGDRQKLHEVIREYAMQQVAAVREGREFDMLQAMKDSGQFPLPDDVWSKISDLSQYVGRAPWQVEEFLHEHVDPVLSRYQNEEDVTAEIRV